jgi:hypothetical protein
MNERQTVLDKLNELTSEVRSLREQLEKINAPAPQSEYLSIAEAAEFTKLSPQTLYRRKSLHRHFGPRNIRILKSDLENLLRRPIRF